MRLTTALALVLGLAFVGFAGRKLAQFQREYDHPKPTAEDFKAFQAALTKAYSPAPRLKSIYMVDPYLPGMVGRIEFLEKKPTRRPGADGVFSFVMEHGTVLWSDSSSKVQQLAAEYQEL